MIRVQLSKDFLPGIFAVVALESLHIHARGVSLAQARGELHLALDGIIVLYEPADEADDDEGRHHARGCCGDGIVAVAERNPLSVSRDRLAKHKNGHGRKGRGANRSTNSMKWNRVPHGRRGSPQSIVTVPGSHSSGGMGAAKGVLAGMPLLALGTCWQCCAGDVRNIRARSLRTLFVRRCQRRPRSRRMTTTTRASPTPPVGA